MRQEKNTELMQNYDKDESGVGYSMTLILFIGLASFIAWASYFNLDQTVRAQGQAIPSERTQIIQSADGGVLAEMLVDEGEFVHTGQVMAVLEKERIIANFEESRANTAALSAALNRARAEVDGTPPVFGNELEDYEEFTKVQMNLYLQKQESLNDRLNTLEASLEMASQELNLNESLLSTGDASMLEVMRSRREVTELEGEISNVINEYLQSAYQEITELEADFEIAKRQLDEHQSRLEYAEIRAPVDGIVKFLQLNTLGGVLQAGDELLQISPTEGGLIIEAKVNPVDIGQLTLGLPVNIKLDAFDYSIYGALSGTLSYISSDTLTEQMDDDVSTYYLVQVALDSEITNPKLANVDLKPGMTALIDIRTGERSVLNYLSKPVTRAFAGALNER